MPGGTGTPGSRVLVRCYAELGDFLDPDLAGAPVEIPVDGNPSVKDLVESAGVPHTEIALLHVDGEPVGFEHRLHGGERVTAYPVFRSLPVTGRLRPRLRRPASFVADVHLGTLARRLRLLGFDTAFGNDWDDEHLARVAVDEDRVLLTRDRGLLKRRVILHGMFVRDDDPFEQLVDVVGTLGLIADAEPFSRCVVCNGRLQEVDRAEIAHRLEPRTRREHDRFRRCPRCCRVYWPGSHHQRLSALVAELRARLSVLA